MPPVLRSYDPRDFAVLYKLDQSCFPAGISYSKTTLRYFLSLRSAECLLAMEGEHIGGFILTEENPPLAHVITLDVAEKFRRRGIGSTLLGESERNLGLRGVRTVLLETAATNDVGVAFWQRHGYVVAVTLKSYYLGRLDAYEMRKILSAPERAGPRQQSKADIHRLRKREARNVERLLAVCLVGHCGGAYGVFAGQFHGAFAVERGAFSHRPG